MKLTNLCRTHPVLAIIAIPMVCSYLRSRMSLFSGNCGGGETGAILGTGFTRPLVGSDSASLPIFPHGPVGNTERGGTKLSTRLIGRAKEKKQKEKGYDDGLFSVLTP